LLEPGSAPDESDEVGALTARHRCWADSMSLNAIATPAARDPGPLVTRYPRRTVAKVDSSGFGNPAEEKGRRPRQVHEAVEECGEAGSSVTVVSLSARRAGLEEDEPQIVIFVDEFWPLNA
jgi:hypothetical protein